MTKDRELIVALLFGRVTEDKRGLPRVVYLKENSAEELKARRALARYLRASRSQVDLGLRFAIADLIDPDCDVEPRKIRFERRNKGRPARDAITEKVIADLVGAQRAMKRESVIRKLGISRSEAFDIYKRWQPIFRRLHRKHPFKKLSDWK